MEKNIFPQWRNHQSLKGKEHKNDEEPCIIGWCSMNYPSILTNPTIRRPHLKDKNASLPENISKLNDDFKDDLEFSNHERPISAPETKL